MPFKKANSPNYYIRRKSLPGFGDSGTLSTGTTRVDRAREMEKLLEWLADNECFDLLEALKPVGAGKSGRVNLADVLRAKKEERLNDYRRTLTDPNLHDAIRAFGKVTSSTNARLGLRHLLAVTPPNVRLSWLADSKHINSIIARQIAGGHVEGDKVARPRKPKSVANHEWTAISLLFQHEYGKARAREILADARYPSADDARDIWLTPLEVARVISQCEWEVRMFLILTASLGIDVSPALRIRVRDVDFRSWRLQVVDTKNQARPRPLDLPPIAVYVLSLLAEGRQDSDHLFTLTSQQINYRWRQARTAASLTKKTGYRDDVRLKDLRHTFAVHYVQAGGNLPALMQRMGHLRGEQSMMYAKHQTSGIEDMEAAAARMGLALPDHLAAALDRPEFRDEETIEIPDWWFDPNAGPTAMRYVKRGTGGWGTEIYNERRRKVYHQARAEGKPKKEARKASMRKSG